MQIQKFPELLKTWGTRAGYGLVTAVRGVFTLLAWIPLGLVLYPFRRYRIVKTVPNLLSGARLVLTPAVAIGWFFIPMWRNDQAAIWQGLTFMAALALLDAIDGPLARILNAESDLGKLLDPAADKMFVFVMLVGYVVLCWHEVGWAAALPVAGVATWAFSVEYKLIRIANSTKNRVLELREQGEDPQLHGANIFGKVKFNLQIMAVFGGWCAMIINPSSVASPLWVVTALMLARYFADKSLGRHREDLNNLY